VTPTQQPASTQAAGGRFWAPMGEDAEQCAWQPHVPAKMLLDALLVVTGGGSDGRHGPLVSDCVTQLVVSAYEGGQLDGAVSMYGPTSTASPSVRQCCLWL
jgi:hypothetical protein